ncbi:TIGR03960 family B12-binding radical SAM protein [bacterium]|nr:TIGR03960 family B12-binding radical SAM protein [bacterium]
MLPAGHPYREIIGRVLRPGRYAGGEQNQVVKDPLGLTSRIALAYPDLYEIGMSHLGLKILYSLVNQAPDLAAERVFAPWPDMEAELRAAALPLVSLESATPLAAFDLVGFSLQYELTYTNILLMLELGGIPLRGAARGEDDPLVVAGGPVAFEPEPLAPFIDCFVLGDGEEALPRLMRDWAALGGLGLPRSERLRRLAGAPGRYLPALYATRVEPDTGLAVVVPPADPALPYPIARAQVAEIDRFPFPTDTPIPEASAIFDRHGIEIARGCTEGCRFCQAGMIYRPVRERSPAAVVDAVLRGLRESGYDEVSLTSLSTADYSAIVPLVRELVERLAHEGEVSLAVSSLRAYGLPEALLDDLQQVRATSLTFAPEAGTQRLRDVINKNVSEEHILESARRVFSRKWDSMKLYFLIGLPTETRDDVAGIVETGARCLAVARGLPGRKRPAQVTCSVSSFVPKPHTPFQWAAMDTMETLAGKQRLLIGLARQRKLRLKWHDPEVSALEGVLSRGDRRVGELIERAYAKGCFFDGWDDHFRFDLWLEAMAELDLEPGRYLGTLPVDAALPWDHVDPGVTKDFLALEYRRSLKDRLSPPCGKPKGAIVHPESLAAAQAQAKPLVCYHCGVACDLSAMKAERIDFQAELVALSAARPAPLSLAPVSYRLVYAKTGGARLLSHLGLLRVWPRALRRAGLAVAYSRGFHPHPLLSFTPALPLGMAGLAEQIEMQLRADIAPAALIERLQPALPEGLTLLAAYREEPARLASRLAAARLLVRFAGPTGEALAARCAALLARPSIALRRERKRELRTLELRPALLALRPVALGEFAAAEALLAREAGGAALPASAVLVELAVQDAAPKAAELVALLGGEPESVVALRLGFRLTGETAVDSEEEVADGDDGTRRRA